MERWQPKAQLHCQGWGGRGSRSRSRNTCVGQSPEQCKDGFSCLLFVYDSLFKLTRLWKMLHVWSVTLGVYGWRKCLQVIHRCIVSSTCSWVKAPWGPRCEVLCATLLPPGMRKAVCLGGRGWFNLSLEVVRNIYFHIKIKRKERTEGWRDERGAVSPRCLEVEAADGRASLPTGPWRQRTSVHRIDFLLHFPLVLHIHACIFSVMQCCGGNCLPVCANAQPHLPEPLKGSGRHTARFLCSLS